MRRRPPARISVSRSIVVGVQGALVGESVTALEHMLHDLIVDQEVRDLILDLSDADEIGGSVQAVLERARSMATARNARLVVRAPADPPAPLLDAAAEIPTFVAVDPPPEPGTC